MIRKYKHDFIVINAWNNQEVRDLQVFLFSVGISWANGATTPLYPLVRSFCVHVYLTNNSITRGTCHKDAAEHFNERGHNCDPVTYGLDDKGIIRQIIRHGTVFPIYNPRIIKK